MRIRGLSPFSHRDAKLAKQQRAVPGRELAVALACGAGLAGPCAADRLRAGLREELGALADVALLAFLERGVAAGVGDDCVADADDQRDAAHEDQDLLPALQATAVVGRGRRRAGRRGRLRRLLGLRERAERALSNRDSRWRENAQQGGESKRSAKHGAGW